jgi:integrase
LPQLQAAQQHRLAQAFRPGTLKNQRTQLRAYYKFCCVYHFNDLNPTPHQLCLYIEFLAQKFRSPQSVRNYLSAVGTLHKQCNLPFTAIQSYSVHLMLRALDHTLRLPTQQKAPLPVSLLYKLCIACAPLGQWGLVLRCAMLFCFFGFLRQSNVAPPSVAQWDASRHTRRADIFTAHQGLTVRLRWTKTHQSNQPPVMVPLPQIPGSPLCPVRAYQAMVQAIPVCDSTAPLLVINNRQGIRVPVTTHMLHKKFCHICNLVGVTPHVYSLHSLRRGGATLAFNSGVPVDRIKAHGTWASNTVWTYLTSNPTPTAPIPASLASAVRTFLH